MRMDRLNNQGRNYAFLVIILLVTSLTGVIILSMFSALGRTQYPSSNERIDEKPGTNIREGSARSAEPMQSPHQPRPENDLGTDQS